MLALHNECLTRRYLLNRLNFLEGLLGFGLGMLCAFEGLRKLGPLCLESSSKDSCFLARAWSSCCTSPTRASCFSRSMRSLAALSSASDSAFCGDATSVVAPSKIHDDPIILKTKFFITPSEPILQNISPLLLSKFLLSLVKSRRLFF